MKKREKLELDFEIDILTNSIRNVISGDSFATEVTRLTKADLKQITKKNGWAFNWKLELDNNVKEVYKLTILNNPSIVQGLLSFTIEPDHIYMDFIRKRPFQPWTEETLRRYSREFSCLCLQGFISTRV